MPVGGRQHAEKLASIRLVAAPLAPLIECLRRAGRPADLTRPTVPIDVADSSTTPDPSCVVRATGRSPATGRTRPGLCYDVLQTCSPVVCGGTLQSHASGLHGRRRPDSGSRSGPRRWLLSQHAPRHLWHHDGDRGDHRAIQDVPDAAQADTKAEPASRRNNRGASARRRIATAGTLIASKAAPDYRVPHNRIGRAARRVGKVMMQPHR